MDLNKALAVAELTSKVKKIEYILKNVINRKCSSHKGDFVFREFDGIADYIYHDLDEEVIDSFVKVLENRLEELLKQISEL